MSAASTRYELDLACGDTISSSSAPEIGRYRHCIHCDHGVKVIAVRDTVHPQTVNQQRWTDNLNSLELLAVSKLLIRIYRRVHSLETYEYRKYGSHARIDYSWGYELTELLCDVATAPYDRS